MSEIIVPDASVLLKWAFDSPDEGDRDNALNFLEAWLEERVEIILPKLWFFEVSNVIMLKKPELSMELMEIFIGYNLSEYETTLELCEEAFKLMRRYGVTFYDAVYHAVAMLKKGVLLTADDAYFKKVSGMPNIVRLKDWA